METMGVKVVFLGYQENPFDDSAFPLFNIGIDGGMNQRTVGLETLKRMNIEIPDYPTFEEWRKIK